MDIKSIKIGLTTVFRFTALSLLILIRQLYAKGLHVSNFQISLISSVNWLGILLFSPIWGALSDTLGERKKLIVLSSVGTALAYFLFIPFHSYWAIIFLSLLASVLGAGFTPISLALVSDKTKKRNRGKRMSVFNSTRSLGFFLGRISYWFLIFSISTILFQFWIVFLLIGVSTLLSFVLPSSKIQVESSISFGEFLKKVKRRLIPSMEGLNLHEKGAIFLLIAVAIRKGAIVGIFSLLFVYMAETGIATGMIGLLVALNPGMQTLFMILLGHIVDKTGRKKIFLFGFVICAIVPFLLSLGTFISFVIGLSLLGVGFSGVQTGAVAFIKDIAPKGKSAELLGLRRTAQGISAVILALFAGQIATFEYFGYVGMLQLMGGLMIIAVLIAFFLTHETL